MSLIFCLQLAAKCMDFKTLHGFRSFTLELRAMVRIVVEAGLAQEHGFVPLSYVSVDWVGRTGIIVMPRQAMHLGTA